MSTLQRRGVKSVLPGLGLVASACAHAATGLPWQVWESPARFAALDAGDIVVMQSSECPGGCRYDRSNRGPEPAAENPYPLRWVYRDGDEVVLFDERGPGALTRFWMTTGDGISRCIDPSIRVLFRFDGAGTPALDLPLAALFDGTTAPFTPPLVADRLDSSGGFVSRMPIAYAQSLRISLLNAESAPSACDPSGWRLLWYQFSAHRLAADRPVMSFVPGTDVPGWRAFLATPPGSDPWHGLLVPQPFSFVAEAGVPLLVANRTGSGWLRGIRLDVPPAARPAVRLRLWFDGELAVDLALADFFATDAAGSARGLLFGEGADGVLYAWWPMPYANEARVELLVAGQPGDTLALSGSLAFDDAAPPSDGTRFHASAGEQCTAAGTMALLDARGAGKLVGLSARYRADGIVDRAYLEGDERIKIDDATAPAWTGTGVEDLHDGGFYFDQGPFRRGLAGAPVIDVDGSGTTSAYRVFATDPPTYASALQVSQEAGLSPAQPVPTCARHVLYGYRRAQPLVVPYARFEVGDPAAPAWNGWEPADPASCAVRHGLFGDEPPSARTAMVCRSSGGASRFHFRIDAAATAPLRLRRTIDVGSGSPGSVAGAPAARVVIDGVTVGRFPPAAANPVRRWQQQEIVLGIAPVPGLLAFEIVHEHDAFAAAASDSAWELRGGWTDRVFAGGFDAADPVTVSP